MLGIAVIARDVLCSPATSVRVKRVFNRARDVCYYRQGVLLLETIRALIITYYYDKTLISKEALLATL